jgi:DNA-binding transcriptional LysR family regulator
MDLNEIMVFIKVVQKGSFTGAAGALKMPKSTVSMKVSSLEKRLGITLIKRSTRKLRLTQAGEGFFRRAIKGVDEILAAEIEVRSENLEPHGRFRITAPVDFGNNILPELTTLFLKKYPKVQLDILLSDRKVDFLEEEVDLAIRAGELKDSALIAKRVGEVAFRIFAAPKYLKIHGTPSTLKELESHDCVLVSALSSGGWKLQSTKRSVTIPLVGKVIVNDFNLALSLAIQGAGITLLPTYLCQEDVRLGKLLPILGEWRSNVSPIHFVYPHQRHTQLVTKAFIELSTIHLQRQLKLFEF